MRRALLLVLVTLGVTAGTALTRGDEASADPVSDEAQFVELLDETRAEAGLPPLIVSPELTNLSRSWAEAMMDAGGISHSDPISAGLTADWRKLGENVGTGPSVEAVMDAFIASPGHYANIVDPDFTHIGVGVVWDGERLYTTHRFMALAPTTAATPVPVPRLDHQPTASTVASPEIRSAAPTPVPASGPPEPFDAHRVAVVLAAFRDLTDDAGAQ